jgi:hypothetical protein
MVADSVEIVTVSVDEPQARQISLRSVHGKYLIQLLDKSQNEACRQIGAHGTMFKLRFRSTAKAIDVLATVRDYVIIPRCKVSVTIDSRDPLTIGYDSPKQALEAFLQEPQMLQWLGDSRTKVEERTIGGVTLAYGLCYNSHYRDWRLISGDDFGKGSSSHRRAPIVTCIEGIVVENGIPGLGASILALTNAAGKSAPRTNVARSSLESTDEQRQLMSTCFKVFYDSVTAEAARLNRDEGYSLTWSTEEIPYLLSPALSNRANIDEIETQEQALAEVPLFLVESDGRRTARSLSDLVKIGAFWTVESLLTRSVEQFIREAKAEVTAEKLIQVSQGTTSSLPMGSIATNLNNAQLVSNIARTKFEPAYIVGRVSDRRLDMRWDLIKNRWVSRDDYMQKLNALGNREVWYKLQMMKEPFFNNAFRSVNVYAPLHGVEASNLVEYFAVASNRALYILPDTPIAKLFCDDYVDDDNPDDLAMKMLRFEALSFLINFAIQSFVGLVGEFYKKIEGSVPHKWLAGRDTLERAISATGSSFRVFNPLSWRHRNGSE